MDSSLYFYQGANLAHASFHKIPKLSSLAASLSRAPRLFAPNISLIVRPRGFGLTTACGELEKLLMLSSLTNLSDDELIAHEDFVPVLYLSLTKMKAKEALDIKQDLLKILQSQMWQHHLKGEVQREHSPKVFLSELIDHLYFKYRKSIAVLIDNYDVPFINASYLTGQEEQDIAVSVYLDMLNAFKKAGTKIKWVLMTGHLKFELTTPFSEGLPVVTDLSFDPGIDTLFGFTKDEVKEFFLKELKQFAPRQGLTVAEMLEGLEQCYGNYVFSDEGEKVICPASVISCLDNEGLFYPYMALGDFAFLKQAFERNAPDLKWLFKDGLEALFYEAVPLKPKGRDFGAMLSQLGIVNPQKITVSEGDNFLNFRYRFACPNEEMRRLFKIVCGLSSPKLCNQPINPMVLCDGADKFDLKDE